MVGILLLDTACALGRCDVGCVSGQPVIPNSVVGSVANTAVGSVANTAVESLVNSKVLLPVMMLSLNNIVF